MVVLAGYLPQEALQEQAHGIRETLSLIVDETVSLDRALELKRQIVTSRDLSGLLDSVEMAVKPESDASEQQHLAGLLYKLDEHPLYYELFLPAAKELNGGQLPGPPSIRPEVQRLRGYMPERYFDLSSDPADLGWFLAQFRDTDDNDPYSRLLFTWIAAILVRYDKSDDYSEICSQIIILGEYAVPPLEDITGSEAYYASEGRAPILKAAQVLLPKLPACQRALRSEWDDDVARRRGLDPGG